MRSLGRGSAPKRNLLENSVTTHVLNPRPGSALKFVVLEEDVTLPKVIVGYYIYFFQFN